MEAKGSRLFYDLAHRIQTRAFIGVKGAYGSQIAGARPNVTIYDNRPGLDWLWPKVGVYVQPSSYESFGMAAVEAMGRGIPVVASPTPGLLESVGEGGVFHPVRDPVAWEQTLLQLAQADVWSVMSTVARDRATFLAAHTDDQIADLELLLDRL